MNEDEAIDTINKKIQRERDLIDGSIAMRRSTNNPAVLSRLDTQIRDGRKNIEYLEGRLHELQVRRMGGDMRTMSVGDGGPAPPPHGSRGANPITPPPKDGSGAYDFGGSGGGVSDRLSGGTGLMPPRAPYAPSGPAGGPKPRANYSKLGRL
jgi:hypothetical protein